MSMIVDLFIDDQALSKYKLLIFQLLSVTIENKALWWKRITICKSHPLMDLRTIMLRLDRFAQTSATRRPRTQLPDPRLVLKTKVSMEDRPLASKIANFFSSPHWHRTLSACPKTANFPMVNRTASKMPTRAVPTNWSLLTSSLSSETRWSNSWV